MAWDLIMGHILQQGSNPGGVFHCWEIRAVCDFFFFFFFLNLCVCFRKSWSTLASQNLANRSLLIKSRALARWWFIQPRGVTKISWDISGFAEFLSNLGGTSRFGQCLRVKGIIIPHSFIYPSINPFIYSFNKCSQFHELCGGSVTQKGRRQNPPVLDWLCVKPPKLMLKL